MCRTRAAAEQHDGVVEDGAALVLVLVQTAQEMRYLLSKEQVVFGACSPYTALPNFRINQMHIAALEVQSHSETTFRPVTNLVNGELESRQPNVSVVSF